MTPDKKVFGMYRSMIISEGEKIKSISFKHILIIVGLVVCAGLIFRFGFMKIIHNMNKHNNQTTTFVINDVQELQTEPVEFEKEKTNNNMYKIIGIIDGHYIVQSHKGLKKERIVESDKKKSINDDIQIERF